MQYICKKRDLTSVMTIWSGKCVWVVIGDVASLYVENERHLLHRKRVWKNNDYLDHCACGTTAGLELSGRGDNRVSPQPLGTMLA